MTHAVEAYLNTFVRQAFFMQALANIDMIEQFDRTLLQDPRPNAAEHILGTPVLQNEIVDAALIQELPQQQPSRSRANDGDLSSQTCPQIPLRVLAAQPALCADQEASTMDK